MSEGVYRAIAEADSGFVESPAGCGKTEAIVRTVGSYCTGTQLILTHTHAGTDALRKRFREYGVPSAKYHIDTIAGWSWSWVRKYPTNAQYEDATDIANWGRVYTAMMTLLDKDFVAYGVRNSYSGVIVDEYQDCTRSMHALIARLNMLLPCRVLGDELQGIFDFNNERLVGWSEVRSEFRNDLGALNTPHRWIKANNRDLGQWLLDNRGVFRAGREPNYTGSPVTRQTVRIADIGPYLIRLTHQTNGSICIIRAKSHNLYAALESALVKHDYEILETNDLSDLRILVLALADGTLSHKRSAVLDFLKRSHGGLPQDDQRFITRIVAGEPQRPQRSDRRALCERHRDGITAYLLRDLLSYCARLTGVTCKLHNSVSVLRCILEKHCETGAELKVLYGEEIGRRRFHSRHVYRSIGSTLLVKGLEFDHAVILRGTRWQVTWGNYSDLYVALSRGTKKVTLIESIP